MNTVDRRCKYCGRNGAKDSSYGLVCYGCHGKLSSREHELAVPPATPSSTSTLARSSSKPGSAENLDSAPPRSTTTSVSGSSLLSSGESCSLDVAIDVASSKQFAALLEDAKKHGFKPVEVHLPDDLSAVHRAVMQDIAWVAGVYEIHDGPGVPFPYSYRWRADALGYSDVTIGRALRALKARGLLEDRGETEPHLDFPRGTKLYAIGPAALKRQAPPVEVVTDAQPEPQPVDESAVFSAEPRAVFGDPADDMAAVRDDADTGGSGMGSHARNDTHTPPGYASLPASCSPPKSSPPAGPFRGRTSTDSPAPARSQSSGSANTSGSIPPPSRRSSAATTSRRRHERHRRGRPS